MSLASIVRKAVLIADKVTGSLQASVTYYPYIGQSIDGRGTRTYASPVTLPAVVEYGGMVYNQQTGVTVQTMAHITFPRPLGVLSNAAGRVNPVDYRDKIVLPDGTTSAIVDIKGFADPSTDQPFMSEVWLGKAG